MRKCYSAAEREETPHASNSTIKTARKATERGTRPPGKRIRPEGPLVLLLSDVLSRSLTTTQLMRAHESLIRHGLEINDPWLPELVRRAAVGEGIIDTCGNLVHGRPDRLIN